MYDCSAINMNLQQDKSRMTKCQIPQLDMCLALELHTLLCLEGGPSIYRDTAATLQLSGIPGCQACGQQIYTCLPVSTGYLIKSQGDLAAMPDMHLVYILCSAPHAAANKQPNTQKGGRALSTAAGVTGVSIVMWKQGHHGAKWLLLAKLNETAVPAITSVTYPGQTRSLSANS